MSTGTKALCRRFDVAGHVFGEVENGEWRPPDVDDVDEHHRVVVRQMDIDVVRQMIGAVPRQLDALAGDVKSAAVLERLFRCGRAAWRRCRAAEAAASPRGRCEGRSCRKGRMRRRDRRGGASSGTICIQARLRDPNQRPVRRRNYL